MLNIKGQFDRVMASFLRAIATQNRELFHGSDNKTIKKEIILNKKYFSFALQLYLKIEWERVKWESKFHMPFKKFKPEVEIQQLIDEFIENDPIVEKINDSYSWIKNNEKNSSIEPTAFTGYVAGFPNAKNKKK